MLEQEDADIVLLQEVTRIPDEILRRYNCHAIFPRFFGGHNARFQTVVLSKWKMNKAPFLASELAGVNKIHSTRYGWIHECEVVDDPGTRYRVVSVHSPAFAVPRKEIDNADFEAIKLKNNPKLWFTEILWSFLRSANLGDDTNWIVGGDFNSSVRFDKRGTRRLSRLNAHRAAQHTGPVDPRERDSSASRACRAARKCSRFTFRLCANSTRPGGITSAYDGRGGQSRRFAGKADYAAIVRMP